jgi:hypothetical protein
MPPRRDQWLGGEHDQMKMFREMQAGKKLYIVGFAQTRETNRFALRLAEKCLPTISQA